MIAIASAWFSGRNATGNRSSSRRPSTYSGTCGPGMFVTIRLNSRVEKLSREAWARIVGGARSLTAASVAAPTACFDSLSPSIALRTNRSRATGSLMYTGSGPRITVSRLPSVPRSFLLRTETGTSARISRPSVRIPRERSQPASAPDTTVRTTSLTVPPSASLTSL